MRNFVIHLHPICGAPYVTMILKAIICIHAVALALVSVVITIIMPLTIIIVIPQAQSKAPNRKP